MRIFWSIVAMLMVAAGALVALDPTSAGGAVRTVAADSDLALAVRGSVLGGTFAPGSDMPGAGAASAVAGGPGAGAAGGAKPAPLSGFDRIAEAVSRTAPAEDLGGDLAEPIEQAGGVGGPGVGVTVLPAGVPDEVAAEETEQIADGRAEGPAGAAPQSEPAFADAGVAELAGDPEPMPMAAPQAPGVTTGPGEAVAGGGSSAESGEINVATGEGQAFASVEGVEQVEGGWSYKGLIVRGAGTKQSPFVVPWDLLIAAETSYAPKQGREELPGWTRLLEGRWVRLTGFMLLPFGDSAVKDLVLMLNQWDGCCIGRPPTPYDAVEVFMKDPFAPSDAATNHGVIEGLFRTEPFVRSGWLLGLYVMDDARVLRAEQRGEVVPPPMHPGESS